MTSKEGDAIQIRDNSLSKRDIKQTKALLGWDTMNTGEVHKPKLLFNQLTVKYIAH